MLCNNKIFKAQDGIYCHGGAEDPKFFSLTIMGEPLAQERPRIGFGVGKRFWVYNPQTRMQKKLRKEIRLELGEMGVFDSPLFVHRAIKVNVSFYCEKHNKDIDNMIKFFWMAFRK